MPIPDGGVDLYIRQDRYPAQFAADVPIARSAMMAVTQRPLARVALGGPSTAAAWRSTPSWFIFGGGDWSIPLALHRSMAERAKARRTVEIPGASHAVMESHPAAVVDLIVQEATAVVSSAPGGHPVDAGSDWIRS